MIFYKASFLSASPFLCHSFHEFNQERGSASAWEIKQRKRLWACLHSRVCVLTGRTWWPLAPADMHTRPKCSAQQGECYGKKNTSCTPLSQYTGQRAEGSRRQSQPLANSSTRMTVDSFPNVIHTLNTWIWKMNMIRPVSMDMSLSSQ